MNISKWYGLIKNKLSDEQLEKTKGIAEIGHEFDSWRSSARKIRKELLKNVENEVIGGALETTWQKTQYLHFDVDEYYQFGDSPLEVLSECIVGDYATYPPPEILIIISRQFRHYLAEGGDISLEEAFFGKPVGKGIYSARLAKENDNYDFFDRQYNNQLKPISQTALVGLLIQSEEYIEHPNAEDLELPNGKTTSLPKPKHNPMHDLSEATGFDIETFLKGYRRWKKRIKQNS